MAMAARHRLRREQPIALVPNTESGWNALRRRERLVNWRSSIVGRASRLVGKRRSCLGELGSECNLKASDLSEPYWARGTGVVPDNCAYVSMLLGFVAFHRPNRISERKLRLWSDQSRKRSKDRGVQLLTAHRENNYLPVLKRKMTEGQPSDQVRAGVCSLPISEQHGDFDGVAARRRFKEHHIRYKRPVPAPQQINRQKYPCLLRDAVARRRSPFPRNRAPIGNLPKRYGLAKSYVTLTRCMTSQL